MLLPLDPGLVPAALKRVSDYGRAASEERLRAWVAEHPTVPCACCGGRGCYVDRAGVLRPFRHEDFDAAAGDVYVASCAVCRGLGRVFVSPEEALRLRRAANRAAHLEIARLRRAVCADAGIEPAHFYRLLRRRLPPGKENAEAPEAWLSAARGVAAFFGVEAAP